MDNWESLIEECSACTACELCKTRTNCVFGVGNKNADILFVGEAPGDNEDKTGFDTDGQRVLVQLYPSKDGGCEMFVTKIGLLDESGTDKKCSQGYERLSSQIKKQKKTATAKNVCSVYAFESTEVLLRVCRRLSDIGYIGDSSAYRAENGKCYLFLADVETAVYSPLDEFSFIAEYGTRENSDMMKYYVSEHGSPLCEHKAVSVLGRF